MPLSQIALREVQYVPRELEPGILYVSEEFGVAVHLCACGCGSKVAVPLGAAEWTFSKKDGKPSLWPSIGSGQLPCNSHYVISNGRVDWAATMSAAQTAAALQSDQLKREAYYQSREPKPSLLRRIWNAIVRLLGR
jgi:hypothetical protein